MSDAAEAGRYQRCRIHLLDDGRARNALTGCEQGSIIEVAGDRLIASSNTTVRRVTGLRLSCRLADSFGRGELCVSTIARRRNVTNSSALVSRTKP